MTPKEKAKELVGKFMPHSSGNSNNNEAKQCALIAVDEVLNDDWFIQNREDLLARKEYWEEVKTQIEKL